MERKRIVGCVCTARGTEEECMGAVKYRAAAGDGNSGSTGRRVRDEQAIELLKTLLSLWLCKWFA
eukprot:276850-Pelagomonas_calceolata.AAC.3